MPTVGAGLRAQVYDAAGKLSPFGALIVVLDFVLSNRILRRNDDRQVDVADIQRLTVKVFCALVGERTTDLIVAPAERVLSHRRSAGSALGDRRGRNRDQVKNL